jgi:actin-related protein
LNQQCPSRPPLEPDWETKRLQEFEVQCLGILIKEHKKFVVSLQDLELQRTKVARQAELLEAAEAARVEAEEGRRRLEAKFVRSDRGTALLKAARMKMEADALREKLAAAEAALKAQVMPLLKAQVTPISFSSYPRPKRLVVVADAVTEKLAAAEPALKAQVQGCHKVADI